MAPEEVVLQLKRNGTFDDLRKRLLTEFQNGVSGLPFVVVQYIESIRVIGRRPKIFKQARIVHGGHGSSQSFARREGFVVFS